MVSVLAGLSLIMPMVVQYAEDRWARLLPTTPFILLFYILTFISTKASNQE